MFNKRISDILPTAVHQGRAVGIEVEMEFPLGVMPAAELPRSYWSVHADGSLLNGMEAVTEPIVPGSKKWAGSLEHLKEFFRAFRPIESERSSTHVHVNFTDVTLMSTVNAACCMWALENVLFSMCEPHRRNNHFCIGISDTVAVIEELVTKFKRGEPPRISDDRAKYCGLNWARLKDLGTLESRIKEGLTDADSIFEWAHMISCICEQGVSFKGTPSDLIKRFIEGPLGMMEYAMGDWTKTAIGACGGPEKTKWEIDKNIPLLTPFLGVDWTKDYTKKNTSRPVRIPVPNRVEDDVIFEDDVIVEFNANNIAPDLNEEDVERPALPFPREDQAIHQADEAPVRQVIAGRQNHGWILDDPFAPPPGIRPGAVHFDGVGDNPRQRFVLDRNDQDRIVENELRRIEILMAEEDEREREGR